MVEPAKKAAKAPAKKAVAKKAAPKIELENPEANVAAQDIAGSVAVIRDDPAKPYKAYAATAVSFVAGVVGIWILDTDPFTVKEFAQACITSGISAGVVGGAAWRVTNPKQAKQIK